MNLIKTEMKQFNPKFCNASKNKKKDLYIQCPHNKLKNSEYCGKHKNNKDDTYLKLYNKVNNIDTHKDEICKEEENINIESQNNDNSNNNKFSIDNNQILDSNKILKNNQIINNLKKNREKYLNLQNNELTILDYYFDKSLSSIPKNKLINFFRKHNLEFTNHQLIQLLKFKYGNENEIIKKNKCEIRNEFILERIQSFFEIMFIAYLNIEKVKIIQKNFKIYSRRKNLKLRGPALYERSICVNETDFYSFDEIKDIPNSNFFSYIDSNKFVYGFDVDSITELFNRKIGKIKNPYNRDYFPDNIRNKLKILQKYKKDNQNKQKQKNKLSFDLIIKSKCIDLFSKIDEFGYQTNIEWLYSKPINTLRYFYRKLVSYWNYKFGLSQSIKELLLPDGDVINSNISIIRSGTIRNKYKLLEKIIYILDKLVSSAELVENRNTGCIIVLYAIGEISRECIESNPWLA